VVDKAKNGCDLGLTFSNLLRVTVTMSMSTRCIAFNCSLFGPQSVKLALNIGEIITQLV